jgi:predicted TIM-barrel fold metal-dependent hydrolase
MIIDSHVHLLEPPYSDEIVTLTLSNGTNFNLGISRNELSPEKLIESMNQNKIDKAIIVAVLEWLDNTNLSKIIYENQDRFIGFARVEDPRNPESIDQLENAVKEYGLKGLKLSNEGNNFTLSDPKIVPLVEKAAELDIPVYCHSLPGWFPGYFYHNLPQHFDVLNQRVPDAKLIIGHMGMQRFMDIVPLVSRPNVYTETSGGLQHIVNYYGSEFGLRFIRNIGVENVVWGSDWKGPIAEIKPELDLIMSLGLDEEELEKILSGNISRILNS